ncbi:hypothetical protein ACI76O_03605 [Capnocytophaga cynodegmi]|uniref:hypothetical protein n=1 Tax=Capnocytophaga cynodegmi TaxID=28189 RepID=UPI00385D9E22
MKPDKRFEEKVSLWLYTHADKTHNGIEDYQEMLHSIIRCEVESITDEKRNLIIELLNDLLSLSFILFKNPKDVENFYNYWHQQQ